MIIIIVRETIIKMTQSLLNETLNDDITAIKMFLDILEFGLVGVEQDVIDILKHNLGSDLTDENRVDTDLMLRIVGTVPPYDLIIPSVRFELGLTITNDQECVNVLESFKIYVTNTGDLILLDKMINFVSDSKAELDSDVMPEIDLKGMISEIPFDNYCDIYNCIDYINEITE